MKLTPQRDWCAANLATEAGYEVGAGNPSKHSKHSKAVVVRTVPTEALRKKPARDKKWH